LYILVIVFTRGTTMIEIEIAPELKGLVRIAVFEIRDVRVSRDAPELRAEIEAYGSELRKEVGDTPIGRVPGIEICRRLYRALGIEPTKTRPSSEALIRRMLKQKPFPKINNLVDALNLAAARTRLSIGLYDLSKISGNMTLRCGEEGEHYHGIGKDCVNVGGRYTLADGEGPFGNPTADSFRTRITGETEDALVVIFAPAELSADDLRGRARMTADLLVKYVGGKESEVVILPG
jgi:DNA/RNA-binding domain of Phe-tRNA-synthetase-like protein